MSKYKISAIPMPMVEVVWHLVEPYLAEVVALVPDETTLDHVKAKAMSGELLIVTISEGKNILAVLTADIREFDTDIKALYIPMMGGEGLPEWADQLWIVLTAVAKDFGCQQIRMAGRRGWIRFLKTYGWEEQYTVLKYNVE